MADNTKETKRLLEMKEQITRAKSTVDQTQGALDQIGQTLKTEYGVNTTKEADELLTKWEGEIKDLDDDIAEKLTQLEADYEWT